MRSLEFESCYIVDLYLKEKVMNKNGISSLKEIEADTTTNQL